MTREALKLTTYLGERDRLGGRLVADVLAELYAEHGVAGSVLLRGVEGFGGRHARRTERLLTPSEDLPLVSIAIDVPEVVSRLVPRVAGLQRHGLVTLERARLLDGGAPALPGADGDDQLKLTVHVGRRQRAAGRPAYRAVVDALHAAGVAGATVLLGVDGTARGERRRARLVGANADVPMLVVSVGDADRLGAVLPALAAMLPEPLLTLERVLVCKRDGARLAVPPAAAVEVGSGRPEGGAPWQKVTVYASEQAKAGGEPLYRALLRRLREHGAAGATTLRGQWGYHGDHAPHGDRMWSVRRHVPVVTTVVDRADRVAALWPVVDAATAATGLVTCEVVPAPPGA